MTENRTAYTGSTTAEGDAPAAPRFSKEDFDRALDTLRRGGIILYPTDTVWGIGCDATDSAAVKRIYELKKRTDSKAMIVLVDSEALLERYVDEVPEVAYQLIEAAVRPTTIVYDKGTGLAPELLASDGSVGVRLTREAFTSALCRRLRHPIVSTSANISGAPAARFFNEIAPEIVEGVDYAVEFRRDDRRKAQPSSVIKLTGSGVVTVIRK